MKKSQVIIAALLVADCAASVAAGYFVSKHILEKKFDERIIEETQKAKEYYQQMYSTPAVVEVERPGRDEAIIETPVVEEREGLEGIHVEKAFSALKTYQGEYVEGDDESRRNLFTSHVPPGEEVLGALMAERDPSKPYIITKAEFYENEPDHEQRKFTYWTGDDVLVDDQEEWDPIDDVERVAGLENLMRFGYGSQDEFVVYIRNESVDPPFDLHVTKSDGKYAIEVLGEDPEINPHIEHSVPRRFRNRDD